MQMKLVKTIALLLAGMVVSLYAGATNVVTMKVEPRWPWNGLVDISFSIQNVKRAYDSAPATFSVKLQGYDKDRNQAIALHTLSLDGKTFTHYDEAVMPAVSGTTYKVVWNAALDCPTLNSSTFTVSMIAEDTVNFAQYLVVNLETGEKRYTTEPPDLSDDTCRTTELWLRYIPAGTFLMGSPEDEARRNYDEMQHQVTLTHGYYMGVFEITQRQWELIMGRNPSYYYYDGSLGYGKGATLPVTSVSYNNIRGGKEWPQKGHSVDDRSYLGLLRRKTGLVFDLPTEAQWEYACRAGTTTAFSIEVHFSKDIAPTAVGCSSPNNWGLYDMHGNVYEWCLDWYDAYGENSIINPVGSNAGQKRVIRGGSFFHNWADWKNGRSACRNSLEPSSTYCEYDYGYFDRQKATLGLRICLPLD